MSGFLGGGRVGELGGIEGEQGQREVCFFGQFFTPMV